jgi:hypothetical protein
LLPTKAGRYRLNRGLASESKDGSVVWSVKLRVEVVGAAIARPPEGWDGLGAGCADVQGRWAWDREKKSAIVEGVAQRTTLFHRKQSTVGRSVTVAKMSLLLVLSWAAATVTSSFLLVSPLV